MLTVDGPAAAQQAIKNADSVSAKAARLLRGNHRLALSGTPIENHLGELWSLFEFLNPGMLGAAAVFQMTQGAARNPDENVRKLLAQALRPFILRRTKEQVAPELPSIGVASTKRFFSAKKRHFRQLCSEIGHSRGRGANRHAITALSF